MDRPAYPSDVSREEFDSIRDMLEAARRKTRPRKHDLYDVFCAVLYFLQTGATWRGLPPGFPPWRTVHEYFTQWNMLREREYTLLEKVLMHLGREQELAQLHRLLQRHSIV
jgi:transposase